MLLLLLLIAREKSHVTLPTPFSVLREEEGFAVCWCDGGGGEIKNGDGNCGEDDDDEEEDNEFPLFSA